MKRIFIILLPLLAFLGASYWIFSGPNKDARLPTPEEVAQLKKMKSSVTKRDVPSMNNMASEFEDDPVGDLKLEGQVVDEDGNAVIGAVVAVDSNPTKRVTSGENGWFSIEGLVVRQYDLEGRQDDLYGTLSVSLTREATPVTLRLQRGGTLVLTVLDETDRHPIANAKVQLGNRAKVEATTDNTGKATIKGVGAWGLLTIDAEGYALYRDVLRASRRPGITQERTITLSPGALVSGVVLDPAGQPVPDAKISAETNSSFRGGFGRNDEEHQIVSDAQGKWQIRALSAGTYRFRGRHEKFAPGLSEPHTLDGKTPKEGVEIRLVEGATLSGKVVSARGEPVASALVGIAQDSQEAFSWEPSRKAYSDENGEFKIEGIIKSPHQIVASFEEIYSPVTPVDLTAGDVSGVTLKLDQDGMIIGVVVTSRSEPVPDAEVSAMPKDFMSARGAWRLRGFPQTLSDADGQFILKGLSAEQTFLLSASTGTAESANPWQGGASPIEASTGDSDIKIVLQDYGTVTGKVTFEDGSVPKEYEISVGWENRETFSNPDGSFELSKIPPGNMVLRVSGPGVERTSSKPFDVKSSETTDVGTILVKAGRSVSGTVVDAAGQPVFGATVMAGPRITGDGGKLSDRATAQMKQSITLEDGTFTVGGLGPDVFYLVADHPSLGRSEMMQMPAGGDNQTATLTLTPTGAIEGTVSYNGSPTRARVSITSQGNRGMSFSVQSQEDGLFRFDRLAAGTYFLTASRSGGGPQGRFSPGGSKSITIVVSSEKTESYHVDIPAGVKIEISPMYEGEFVKNVAAQLVKGSVSPTDNKNLQTIVEAMTPDEVRYGMIMDVPMLSSQVISIEDVLPGSYTLCLSRTPTFAETRNNAFDPNQLRPVSCAPITVADSPEKQSFTQEVPAPQP